MLNLNMKLKTMKKYCFLITLLLNIALVKAQNTPYRVLTPKQQAEHTVGELQAPLLLSDVQKTKLFTILFNSNSKMDSLKKAGADRSLLKAQYQGREQAIATLLTPDQLTEYQAYMAQKMGNRKIN